MNQHQGPAPAPDALWTLLDYLPCGVVLADSEGRAPYLNRTARELCAAADGLALVDGCLRAGRISDTVRLSTAIVTAVETGRASLAVPRPSGLHPYGIELVRLICADTDALIALFVSDPVRTPRLHAAAAELFALTPAELRLLELLGRGLDTLAIATELGISRNTARLHLEHLLRKTRTHRQGELVALLRGLHAVQG